MGRICQIRVWLDDQQHMATGVYKHGPSWSFRANVPGSGGKQIRRSGFTSAEAAYKARLRYLNGQLNGVRANKLTVGDWLEQWWLVVDETLEPSTSAKYRDTINTYLLPLFGTVLLQQLDEAVVRDGYRKLVEAGYATNTIKGAHRRMRTALEAAKREAVVLRNVVANVSPPKGKPAGIRTVFTNPQAIKFGRHLVGQRDEALWVTLLGTGARKGEICALLWSDVDLDRGEVWIRKSKTNAGIRIVPLGTRLVEALRSWRAAQAKVRLAQGARWRGGDHVFTSTQLQPHNPTCLGRRLTQLCARAGVPRVTVHELRHTFATLALENKADIKEISAILGHSNTGITRDLYMHVSTEQARSVIESLTDRMFG